MESSKSTQSLKTQVRDKLFYKKYKYKARFYCPGIQIIMYARDDKWIKNQLANPRNKDIRPYSGKILEFFDFYKEHHLCKNDLVTIRLDYNVTSVFSNDLKLLQTLEDIGCPIEYTEAIDSIPEGIKYFVKEPKHKYRLYFKSKRVSESFPEKLKSWIERYENTGTVITPCSALKYWYTPSASRAKITNMFPSVANNNWRLQYTVDSFFIDYNDESVLTLFMLMFDGIAGKKYKLLKKPD